MRRRTVDARRRPVVVSVRHPVGSRTPDHRFGWWDAVCAGRVAARRWERAAWAGDRWIDGLTRRGCASGGSFLWVVRARSRVTRRGCACRGSFLVVRAWARVTRRGCACRGSFLVVRARSRVTRRGCACPAPLGWGSGCGGSPGAVAHRGPSLLSVRDVGLVSPGAVAHVGPPLSVRLSPAATVLTRRGCACPAPLLLRGRRRAMVTRLDYAFRLPSGWVFQRDVGCSPGAIAHRDLLPGVPPRRGVDAATEVTGMLSSRFSHCGAPSPP